SEVLTINKALGLHGAQFGVDARTRMTTPAQESNIVASAAGAALVDISAANVTIDGFTIDGRNPVSRDARHKSVTNAVVPTTNAISNNDITATMHGYGTNERASQAAATVLTGNTFTLSGGAGSQGVQLFNIYKTNGITLSNNTIAGAATGVFAFINGGSATI